MAYQDVILGTATLSKYFRANEASGTNVNEEGGGTDGTAVGMVMGGFAAGGPEGIGGPAPAFNGSGHILLSSSAILGGSSSWTVEAWMFYQGTGTCTIYAEGATSGGGDWIRGRIGGSFAATLGIDYGDDTASTSQTTQSTFANGVWTLCHFVKRGTTYETWWNGGKRQSWDISAPGTTWTTSGVQSWMGAFPTPAGDGWIGSIREVALYTSALSEATILAHYDAGTPLTRELIDVPLFKPDTAVWNQRLDDPLNPPTVAVDSAQQVQNLIDQISVFTAGVNDGRGPVYVVDNTTPTEAVRILGGASTIGGIDLYNAMQNVPIPAGMISSASGDQEVTIYNKDTDSQWEFWHMFKTLLAPPQVTQQAFGAGTIPAGTYEYLIVPALADDTEGNYTGGNPAHLVLNGSQGAKIQWNDVEGADKFHIYRSNAGFSPLSNYKLIASVAAGTLTYTDTGATAGASYAGLLTAVTPDWGCSYGGYMTDVANNIGHYEGTHYNWGATATSLPMLGGLITLEEMRAGVIPHALAMAPTSVWWTHVYPAQRNDVVTLGSELIEGTRFALNPDFDITTLPNRFSRMIALAYQVYGGYVSDNAGAITCAYVEDTRDCGRNFHSAGFDGRLGYEVFNDFPFSEMYVVDPAWTLAATGGGGPAPVPKLETITDDFADGVIDPAKWTASTGTSEVDGVMRIQTSSQYSNLLSIPGKLTGSFFQMQIISVPTPQDIADQSGVRLISTESSASWIDLHVEAGAIVAKITDSFSGVNSVFSLFPYAPATHRALRIREASGTIYFETFDTGWTVRGTYSYAATGWPATHLDTMQAYVYSGNYAGVAGRPDFVIDNVNTQQIAAPFAPTDIAGMTGWWKTEDLALSDGDPVASWPDASGLVHDLTQATSGKRPVYDASGIPSVVFDGVDDYLATAAFASPTAGVTVMVVCALEAVDSVVRTLLNHAGAATWVRPFSRALLRVNGAMASQPWEAYVEDAKLKTNRAASSTAAVVDVWHLVEMRYDQTQVRIAIDGVKVGSKLRSHALTSSTQPLFVGSNTAGAENLKGRIAEIVVYSRGV